MRALSTPAYTIAANAGVNGSVVVEKILSLGENMGYDALNDTYVDMLEAGIIDPTKVRFLLYQSVFLCTYKAY